MTQKPNYHRCGQCQHSLNEDEKVCHSYCSKSRDINISVVENIKLSESLEMKKFTQEIKGFVTHLKQGWFPSKDKKYPEGVNIVQSVDREKDFYKKKVIDKKTGVILKDLEEPLSDHH